jgi:hypothetical protein
MAGDSSPSSLNLGHFHRSLVVYLLHFGFGEISPSPCVHIGEAIPFVHFKFTHSDFDIQAEVVFTGDSAFCQVLTQHVLMRLFTTLDLRHQSPSGFCKITHGSTNESFPPFVLLSVCSSRSLSSANADERADFPSGPFVNGGFVENLRSRVIFSCALVEIYILTNLNGLES